MPFEPGNQIRAGSSNPNAGRKPNTTERELKEAMQEGWPAAARVKTIKKHVLLANSGDVGAFRVLMAYGFGTPGSLDETKKREELEVQAENFFIAVEKHLGTDALIRLREARANPTSQR